MKRVIATALALLLCLSLMSAFSGVYFVEDTLPLPVAGGSVTLTLKDETSVEGKDHWGKNDQGEDLPLFSYAGLVDLDYDPAVAEESYCIWYIRYGASYPYVTITWNDLVEGEGTWTNVDLSKTKLALIMPNTSNNLEYINWAASDPDNPQVLTPQVNVPEERIVIEPEEVEDDVLRFALYRTRRSLAEKAEVPFRIFEKDMTLHGEPVKHEQLVWSCDDASIATVDSATGWVKLTGKAGSCYIMAEYTDASGTHTAKYKVVAY